jgi:very-short-patch-repair endonuclease
MVPGHYGRERSDLTSWCAKMINTFMKKYGIIKACLFCGSEFETRPRFVDYCSQKCKNPLNRGEYEPWNKGKKLTEEQKAKQNREGLKKGWGWNKGVPNEAQSIRWRENNPNKDGAVNAKRKIDGTLSFAREKNGMWGKNHSEEVKEICRKAKLKNFEDGIYGSGVSKGEEELVSKLKEKFDDLVHQYVLPNYHRAYDIYIPKLNLIVEYDGNYWHREEKYLNKDVRDTKKALKEGYNIFRYWESTVKEKGIDLIVDDIVKLKGKFCRILKES